MIRQDVCYLINEEPKAHGALEKTQRTERMVYCTIRSATYHEVYEGLARGMRPELIIGLADMEEYDGEHVLRYDDKEWRVIRHYMSGNGGIELTVERVSA